MDIELPAPDLNSQTNHDPGDVSASSPHDGDRCEQEPRADQNPVKKQDTTMENKKQPDDGQMISKDKARAILAAARKQEANRLAEAEAAHQAELAAMRAETDKLRAELEQMRHGPAEPYNNRPGQKRAARHQRQLAILREAAQTRSLSAWGQTNVGKYLRDHGAGCAPETAADLVTMLVDEGLLVRAPSGRAKLPPVGGQQAA